MSALTKLLEESVSRDALAALDEYASLKRRADAVDGLVSLINDAQSILAACLPPDGISENECISQLLGLLDGPQSRAALSNAKTDSVDLAVDLVEPDTSLKAGYVAVPVDAVNMLLHKFERAGGPWKVAERGIELGQMAWASNVENSLDALTAAIAAQGEKS